MNLSRTTSSLLTLGAILGISSPAWAYLDPGTGSMIIQFLIAGILGGLYAIKTFWRQIVGFLSRVLGKK